MIKRLAFGLLALVFAMAGPSHAEPQDPEVLRFSAIPDQPAAQVLQQHKALVDRLCAAIKKSCRWVPAESYESLVDRLGRGEIDVAYFGAVTFAQASHRYRAVPLAMRDVDFRWLFAR